MIAAAHVRLRSVRRRFLIGALFAVGAALTLGSAAAGFSWYLALAVAMGFDYLLGKFYLSARGAKERVTTGALFVGGCLFSLVVFAAMPILLAFNGGGAGRVLGVLMAASALVSLMPFAFQAPRFMLLTVAPPTAAMLLIPAIPVGADPATALAGAVGIGCGVAGFLSYFERAVRYNTKVAASWRTAHEEAKERQREAEAKRAEAEAANSAKSEILALMTDELRTPLNAVIGYAEIIQDDLSTAGRKDMAGDAARITSSARHLLSIVDQILDLSSKDAGQEALALSEVDVRKLIEDGVVAALDGVRASGNSISVHVAAGAERAFTDGGKLAACLSALVSNAVKFTSNGTIALTAGREEREGRDWLLIGVSDTGVGIAAADLPRVFTPFTQIESAATRANAGMGLGLSIAQRLARALGGEVSATSEVGVGSTFTLRAPMRLMQQQSARAAA
ncbi:MAG: sensor histidine kinase [Vitreimonas sp.]